MATSGTYNFSMDIDEVIQEASEMIGGEQTLGNQAASARRSINLLLQDWQNRGILLWTADTTAVSITASVTTFAMSSATIDITEAVLNRDSTDLQLERITMEEYLKIPNKTQTGRPMQFAVRRNSSNIVVHLWPLSDVNTDKVKLEKISYMQDINNSSQTPDISRRFLPCLTVGLSYYMSMKRPGIEAGRISFLKQEYEERLERALHEDRERASAYFLPRIRVY